MNQQMKCSRCDVMLDMDSRIILEHILNVHKDSQIESYLKKIGAIWNISRDEVYNRLIVSKK